MKVVFSSCLFLLLSLAPGVTGNGQTSSPERNAEWHLQQARELDVSNDPRAENSYLLAIKLKKGWYPEAWEGLSQVLCRTSRYSEAVKAFEKYIAQTPPDFHYYDYQFLANLKRLTTLQSRVDRSTTPSLEDLLEFIPLTAACSNREYTIGYAERAVALYPGSSKAHLVLSRLLSSGQNGRQLALIKKAVELDPADPEAHTSLGGYYFIPMGNIAESIKEFRTAVELSDGQYAYAWQGLGRALAVSGKKKEAIEAYENYLRTRKVPSQNDDFIQREIERLQRESSGVGAGTAGHANKNATTSMIKDNRVKPTITFCRPTLDPKWKRANISFNSLYSFAVDKSGRVVDIRKIRDDFVGKDALESCMTKWRIAGYPENSRFSVYFVWKHGKGWIRQEISGNGFERVMRMNDLESLEAAKK